jgi:phage-related protein (TIGR01555 family)
VADKDVIITEEKQAISIVDQLSIIGDGLHNLSTGLGGAKDKATFNQWSHSGKNYDHVTLSARYREDWLSQKVCKVVPQDMTREWRSLETPEAQEADQQWEVRMLFKEAYQWARLYGTSFIVLDINDGRTTEKPVNWKGLKPGCLISMHVVDRTRIVAIGEIDQEPMSPSFGMPITYQFVNSPDPIHKERLIRFEGTELPIYERQRNLWYSDSVLIPLMPQMDNFHTTSMAAAQMVQEANIDVITVDGLANILQNSKGTEAMLDRFSSWKQIKSVFGVSILDSSEKYEQKKVQLSGVKDLIWEYLRMVAASVGIPATRFLSASPDGLNATGESDLVNYIEMLTGLQKDIFDPRLLVVDELLSANYGMDRKDFKYEWNCIFPESSAQKQDRLGTQVEWIARLVEAGVMSRDSALMELKKEGVVSLEAQVGQDPNAITKPNIGG